MSWRIELRDMRDAIAYGVLCASNEFPNEDYLPKNEQMTAERFYSELKERLDRLCAMKPANQELQSGHEILETAISRYRAGRINEGAWKLQDLDELLRSL